MNDNRDKYIQALKSQLEDNVFRHSLALEACMGGIYDFLSQEGKLCSNLSKNGWMLAGLVHDIDYSGEYKKSHPKNTKEVLGKYGLSISKEVDEVVKSHAPEITGVKPKTQAQWAIFCADSLTGLITAVALVYPSKKLADVKLKSVLKKFKKSPNFAAGTRRESVAMCERKDGLDIPLDKFIEVCLNSMKNVAQSLNL